MPGYISSFGNRLYAAREMSYGQVPAPAAGMRIPAVKLSAKQEQEVARRRDKIGGRTFGGVPVGTRRRSSFSLTTVLASWQNQVTEPSYGPLFSAALGDPAVLTGALTVASCPDVATVAFAGGHSLGEGQAVAFGREIRFVSSVVSPSSVRLNAPLAAVPAPGSQSTPTATYRPSTELPSVSIFDYWDPSSAVQRIVCGAGVDRWRLQVNGDFHEFEFSGPARDIIDSASFTGDEGALTNFPEEPAIANWNYTVVPGHLGQAWIGSAPDQFFTLTHAAIEVDNQLDVRAREFGSDLPRVLLPGERKVTTDFSLYAQDDAQTEALYQAARQQSPVQVMLQLGNRSGELFAVWLKAVMLQSPHFNDSERRLEWQFTNCRAQGTNNDDVIVAFG